jgi:ABC-type phosphate/phosphonate transport system ATPase subunit
MKKLTLYAVGDPGVGKSALLRRIAHVIDALSSELGVEIESCLSGCHTQTLRPTRC